MNRRQFIHMSAALSFAGFGQRSAANNIVSNQATPEEIEGPFYPLSTSQETDFDLTQISGSNVAALGQHVIISGEILDTTGQAISGVSVDLWQANAAGRYRHPHDTNPAPLDNNFQGRGLVLSDTEGRFTFKTVIPGAYPVSQQWIRPPHLHFKISKKGYFELITQMYFDGMPLNNQDRLLQSKTRDEQNSMLAIQKAKQMKGSTSITMR